MVLSGCLGGSTASFEPGTGYKETGRTVHLKMWIVDIQQADLAPGLQGNIWAFCAEAARPDDAYSRNAVEYREQSGIVPEGSEGKCSVPGPTIRVRQGDRVVVDFENTHVHPHVIHWHGQLVGWESDGTPGVNQDSVMPGDTFRYEFVAKKAGTLWYHCHVDTQFHVMQGLYGGFIVEPHDDAKEPDADKEYLLVLSTMRREHVEYIAPKPGETVDPHAEHKAGGGCGVTGEPGCENPPVDVTPDIFLLNGKSAPLTEDDPLTLIKVQEGQSVRLRLLNAGTTVETVHPHGHDVKVTHRDGSPLESPFWVDTLTIGPAERYDVVFRANNPGLWVLHTHVNDHETNCGSGPGGMETMIVYSGFENRMGTFRAEAPGSCAPAAKLVIPEDLDQPFVASMSVTTEEQEPVREFTFPLFGCAIQELRITLTARASDTVLQSLNEVHVELFGPAGQELLFAELGSGTTLQWSERYPGSDTELGSGNHTLRVSGRALMTTIEARVQANYFDNVDAIEKAGLACNPDGHAGH
jgi:manganese oxidase